MIDSALCVRLLCFAPHSVVDDQLPLIQTRDIESHMAGKQAKILNDKQLAHLLAYASTTRYPLRNRVIVLLSVKAGLRAGEIAKLTWDMVLDRGSLRDVQLLAGHWPIGTAHRRDQILRSSSISFAET
jgi:integrase